MTVTEPQKMDLRSMSIPEEQKNKLKEIFPEVFNEGKIDWEKLKITLGEELDTGNERYGMNWPGKRDCFKVIQQPSIGTLKPCPQESVDWNTTENLFIEGDNLEVLKLLQKAYYGKIKMIYIDPPYNTGHEFIYPDKYSESLDTYLAYTGQVDENGYKFSTNTEAEGRFHSKWMSMIYPRLFLAKNLLRDDGVIFISIDDHEVDNLKKVCNEVFGEDNFVANVVWEKKYSPQNDAKWFSDNHDHILIYAKNKEIWMPYLLPRSDEQNARYTNRDNDQRGPWKSSDFLVKTYSSNYDYPITTPSGRIVNPPNGRCWRTSQERFQELVQDNRIWFGESGGNVPSIKRFLSEVKDGKVPLTIWKYSEVGHNQDAAKEIRDLLGGTYFDTPKPSTLISQMLRLSARNEDIILDFFAGSCTTAHALLDLNKEDGGNRQYICVQLPEPCDEKSEAYKAGFKTIADIGKERIRRVINKIKEKTPENEVKQQSLLENNNKTSIDNLDLGFKVFKLDQSNFKIWDGKTPEDKTLDKQIKMAIDHINPNSSDEDIL